MVFKNPEFWHAVPFIGLMVKPPTEGTPMWSLITRLLEAAIIGGVVMYGTVQVLSKDIEWLKITVSEVNQKQDKRIERIESWFIGPK